MAEQNILISSSRSGTNFFLEVIGTCDPGMLVLNEIFKKDSPSVKRIAAVTGLPHDDLARMAQQDPVAFWTALTDACGAKGQDVVAKIFYYHAPRRSPIWAHFRDHSRVIHLIRRNLLRSFISKKIMDATGVSKVVKGEKTPQMRLSVDPAEAELFIRERLDSVRWTREFYQGARYVELFYEDISASPADCARAIREAGILPRQAPPEGEKVKVTLKRQSKGDLSGTVENYDAVRHLDRDHFEAA